MTDANRPAGRALKHLFDPPPNPASLRKHVPEPEFEYEPLNTTFGVEMEFMLAVCSYPKFNSGGFHASSRTRQRVINELEKPMFAVCAKCGKQHQITLPLSQLKDATDKTYSKWKVVGDASLDASDDEKRALNDDTDYFQYHDIEINSRVLSREENLKTSGPDPLTGCEHEINYEEEIKAVMTRLHEAFDTPSGEANDIRLLVNESCGLHVHVGNQKRGFPLPTIKNVLSTYLSNERGIDALHYANRINGSTLPLDPLIYSEAEDRYRHAIGAQTFNISLSGVMALLSYRLRKNWSSDNPSERVIRDYDFPSMVPYPESHIEEQDIFEAVSSNNSSASLTLIQRAPDLIAMRQLQNCNPGSTVNLKNLAPYNPSGSQIAGKKMTIEFRQHAGTLQWSEIIPWIDVVVSIVEHAHETPAADFKKLCDNEWQAPEYHIIDLLKEIGCSESTVNFYRHKLGMRVHQSDYASDLFQEETRRNAAFPQSDLSTPLMKLVAEKRLRNLLPSEVLGRINQKFMRGGYGQFSPAFLDKLNFDGAEAGVKEKLTIGWNNTEANETEVSRSDDDESDVEIIV